MAEEFFPEELLYAGEPLAVCDVWERTADRHDIAVIHDTKVSITVADDLELTCSFCNEHVTTSAPLLKVSCDISKQLTSRIQRWVDAYMRA
jgi:hypothetical protein